jgi:LmbE family N-acetylglucosaminyl deacetylase
MQIRAAMRLLCIFAHPDDESFLTAGTMARARARGDAVALICATRGGAGRRGEPPQCDRGDLPAVRERELRAAAAILDVTDVVLYDYPDGALASAPVDEMRGRLVAEIRRVRPDVVITFDPNGTNGHADHVAISRFATDAVQAAADDRWFPEAGPAHATPRLLWTPPIVPWKHEAARSLTDAPAGVDVLIDIRPWAHTKARALRAHRTQHVQIDRFFFGPESDVVMATEAFRQAWGPALPARPATDLFAGLVAGAAT